MTRPDPPGEPAPHRVPVEESIDLHAFTPRDGISVVEEYLEAAARKRYREVRLIHGKGTGAQRAAVRALLARHPLVDALCPSVWAINVRRDDRVIIVLDTQFLEHFHPDVYVLHRNVSGSKQGFSPAVLLEGVHAGGEKT